MRGVFNEFEHLVSWIIFFYFYPSGYKFNKLNLNLNLNRNYLELFCVQMNTKNNSYYLSARPLNFRLTFMQPVSVSNRLHITGFAHLYITVSCWQAAAATAMAGRPTVVLSQWRQWRQRCVNVITARRRGRVSHRQRSGDVPHQELGVGTAPTSRNPFIQHLSPHTATGRQLAHKWLHYVDIYIAAQSQLAICTRPIKQGPVGGQIHRRS